LLSTLEALQLAKPRTVFGAVQALLQLVIRVPVVRACMMEAHVRCHWEWIEKFVGSTLEAAAKEAVAMVDLLAAAPTTPVEQPDGVSLSPEIALSQSTIVVAPVRFAGQDEAEDGCFLQPPQLVAKVLARVRGFRSHLPPLPEPVLTAPEEAVEPAAPKQVEPEQDEHTVVPEEEGHQQQVHQLHQPEEDHPTETIANTQPGPEETGEGEAGGEPEETTETPPELERGA
jgi:hypothetical protein